MSEFLRSLYMTVVGRDDETPRVLEFARKSIQGKSPALVVDVGCGYGRTLRALRSVGIAGIGIELNPSIVASNKHDGLHCLTPEEFDNAQLQPDVIIMSHIIEHFSPDNLYEFIDRYMDYLRPGGHLIIATPLLHPRFFDDFDHVKPYHPTGISMVFGEHMAQVQYYSRNRLSLVDLWIRRSPRAITFVRGLQMKASSTRYWQSLNFCLALIYWISIGLIGQPTGWVGFFQKVERRD